MFVQHDCAALLYGLSLILFAVAIFKKNCRKERGWNLLAFSGFFAGFHAWLGMGEVFYQESALFHALRASLFFIASIFLLEASFYHAGQTVFFARAAVITSMVAVFAGSLTGSVSFSVLVICLIVLPALLLLGTSFFKKSRESTAGSKWLFLSSIAVFGISIILFFTVLIHGVLARANPVFLKNFILIPVEILLAAGVFFLTFFLENYLIEKESYGENGGVLHRFVFITFILIALTSGFISAGWRGRQADLEMRENLLEQACAIAETIEPEDVHALTFSLEDRRNPVFQKLRQHFIRYAELTGQKSIYSMAKRDGVILFGPENLPEDDRLASPPGTVYREPPPVIADVFESGRSTVTGPFTDEYGTFVSAFAPVRDSSNGDVLLVVGIDVLADRWTKTVAVARLGSLLFSLVVVIFLISGWMALHSNNTGEKEGVLKRFDLAILSFILGVILTIGAVFLVGERDRKSLEALFREISHRHAKSIVRGVREIIYHQPLSLADFLASNPFLSNEEFRALASRYIKHPSIAFFAWAPGIPAQKVQDKPVYRIASSLPFQVSDESNENILCSGKEIAEILERAIDTGLPATGFIPCSMFKFSKIKTGNCLFIAGPVYTEKAEGRSDSDEPSTVKKKPAGFLGTLLFPDNLLMEVLGYETGLDSMADVELLVLEEHGNCRRIAGWPVTHADRADRNGVLASTCVNNLSRFYPLFFFNLTMGIKIIPGPRFFSANPSGAEWLVLFTGLFLTVTVSSLLGFLSSRRMFLEKLIARRTGELVESEQRFRALFNAARDAFIVVDSNDGKILQVNHVAERLLKRRGSELAGTFLELYCPFFRKEKFSCLIEQADSGAVTPPVESELIAADGERIPVEINASVISFPDGKKVLYGLLRDIRDRRNAERELKRSARFLQDIINSIPNPVFFKDTEGRYTLCNRAFMEFLGLPAEKILGKTVYDIAPSDLSKIYHRADLELIEKGGKQIYESEVQNASGERRNVIFHKSVVTDPAGHLTGLVGIILDITEIKKTEETLRETNRQLEEAIQKANMLAEEAQKASRAKSLFLANMSHEIRTPLNGIVGMTELLVDSSLSPEQRQYASIIKSSADTLRLLIDDILDFSKIEARKLELERLPFNLENLLEECAEMLAVRAQEKKLELVNIVEPGLPVLIYGDPKRLKQIILNLGGNAIKFTEKGEIVIHACSVGISGDKISIKISITDTGIGIPPDKIAGLFAPFTQADSSITRRYGGTGLGLAITRELVDLMGGSIGVTSEVGKGSTFYFTIPFEMVTGKELESQGEEKKPAWISELLKGVRILIVERNTATSRHLAGILTSMGCEVTEATDGKDALSLIEKAYLGEKPFKIAVVSNTVLREEKDSFERLEKRNILHETLLIMLVPVIDSRAPGIAGGINCAGVIFKPVRRSRVQELILQVLKKTDLSPAPEVPLTPLKTVDAPLTGEGEQEKNKKRFIDGTKAVKGEGKARILLAEDNEVNRKVFARMIKKLGYQVFIASDGREAIEMLAKESYDLVLMDCQMPELDGFEATMKIRSGEARALRPDIPIIALTAHALRGDREKCMAAGMNDYLAKPVEFGELAAMLEKWLSASSGEEV